ncbi:hypothetical protein D3C77_358860 [compost metagenome]
MKFVLGLSFAILASTAMAHAVSNNHIPQAGKPDVLASDGAEALERWHAKMKKAFEKNQDEVLSRSAKAQLILRNGDSSGELPSRHSPS